MIYMSVSDDELMKIQKNHSPNLRLHHHPIMQQTTWQPQVLPLLF